MTKGGSGKVISMAEQKYIKQLYEDGVSKSEIQRRTKLNYRTVCKYADKEDWNDERQPNLDPDSYPVLGRFIPIIDEWLDSLKLAFYKISDLNSGRIEPIDSFLHG